MLSGCATKSQTELVRKNINEKEKEEIAVTSNGGDKVDTEKSQHSVKSSDSVDFETIKITENDCSSLLEVFEVKKSDDGVLLTRSYLSMMNDETTLCREVTGDSEMLAAIQQLLGECEVLSWDGFSESDPDVLDGGGFDLEMILSDGKTVNAHGSNAYPKHYFDLREYIYNILYYSIVDNMEYENDYYKIVLPANWISNVTICHDPEYNAFIMKTEANGEKHEVQLFRVDFRGYEPMKDAQTIVLGKLKSKTTDEEVYLSVYLYNSYMNKDWGNPEQYQIYDFFEQEKDMIINTIEAADGYELIPAE